MSTISAVMMAQILEKIKRERKEKSELDIRRSIRSSRTNSVVYMDAL